MSVACGRDTARRNSGAKLKFIEKMAHDLPPLQIGYVAGLICVHIHEAKGNRSIYLSSNHPRLTHRQPDRVTRKLRYARAAQVDERPL